MDLTDARVLVTGANGFVGARACTRLATAGAHVRALVRTAGTAPSVDGVDEVVGDFTDPDDARRACDGADAVVHTAAAAGPDWDAVRHVNTRGTAVVADAAVAAGVRRFVHVSTYSIYDRPPDLDHVDEDTGRVDPDADDANPYSVTKAEAEDEVRSRADDVEVVILRPPAVFGYGPTSTWGHKVPEGLTRGELLVGIPGHAHLSWVHVDDLVGAAVAAIRTDGLPSGRAYNIVTSNVVWRDYVGDLHDLLPDPPALPPFPDGPAWTGTTGHERATAELGWTPHRTYGDALAETRAGWN